MESQKLFELLLARVAAGDMAPVYLGEVAATASLPSRLPPIFAWLDHAGDLHIFADRTSIARICIRESIRTGLPCRFGSAGVEQAVSRFCDLVASTWAATLSEHTAVAAELKSARQRAALRWRAA